jgi:hypothetical protein
MLVLAKDTAEFDRFTSQLSQKAKEWYAYAMVQAYDYNGNNGENWVTFARAKAKKARIAGYRRVELLTLDTSAKRASEMVQLALCFDKMLSGSTVKEVFDAADNFKPLPAGTNSDGTARFFFNDEYLDKISDAKVWVGGSPDDQIYLDSAALYTAIDGNSTITGQIDLLDKTKPIALTQVGNLPFEELQKWESGLIYATDRAVSQLQAIAEAKGMLTSTAEGQLVISSIEGIVQLIVKYLIDADRTDEFLLVSGLNVNADKSTNLALSESQAVRVNILVDTL